MACTTMGLSNSAATMACTTMGLSNSAATMAAKENSKEYKGLRRSKSAADFCQQAIIKRSHSEDQLSYSVNRIHVASIQSKLKTRNSFGILPFSVPSSIVPKSLRSLLFDSETSKDMSLVEKDTDKDTSKEVKDTSTVETSVDGSESKKGQTKRNWVEWLIEIRDIWKNKSENETADGEQVCDGVKNGDCNSDGNEGGCDACYTSEEDEGDLRYNSESFLELLDSVPMQDIKLYSQLAFLCNRAYVIPDIKANDLRKNYGLEFVTSSVEKKAEANKLRGTLDQDSTHLSAVTSESTKLSLKEAMPRKQRIPSSVAYKIAASAASYVQSRALASQSKITRLPLDVPVNACINKDQMGDEKMELLGGQESEKAVHVAESTMTAVVAAGDEEKQEAARDLQSMHSSPCQWFVCDNPDNYTRCFIIQGSDSLASWQANLLFEPIKFEGTEALVHRGIYEVAKGIYEQFISEIVDHLNKYGNRAKLRFSGHSLGGSLSLLVSLMLVSRKIVKPSALQPVVTFGSPFIFCGGEKILDDLGLNDNHIHCVMMHRDIVPRAFSCNYPTSAASILKRLNSSFRSHPCLNKNKFLYSPLGKILILQPDETSSPPHPFLPPGIAFYSVKKPQHGSLAGALREFLNSPHPLETLSSRKAYGSEGTISRDHHSRNYLKAVNGVLQKQFNEYITSRKQFSEYIIREEQKRRSSLWQPMTLPLPNTWGHDLEREKGIATKEITYDVLERKFQSSSIEIYVLSYTFLVLFQEGLFIVSATCFRLHSNLSLAQSISCTVGNTASEKALFEVYMIFSPQRVNGKGSYVKLW